MAFMSGMRASILKKPPAFAAGLQAPNGALKRHGAIGRSTAYCFKTASAMECLPLPCSA